MYLAIANSYVRAYVVTYIAACTTLVLSILVRPVYID